MFLLSRILRNINIMYAVVVEAEGLHLLLHDSGLYKDGFYGRVNR